MSKAHRHFWCFIFSDFARAMKNTILNMVKMATGLSIKRGAQLFFCTEYTNYKNDCKQVVSN